MGLPGDAIIEATFRGSIYNQAVLNIWHYRVSAQAPLEVTPITEMQGLADILNDNSIASLKNLFLACCTQNYTLQQVSVQALIPVRYRKVTVTAGNAGLSGPTEVTNVQASITWVTQFAGRNQVGGTRLCASAGAAQDGLWSAPQMDAMAAFGQEFLKPVVNTTLESGYQPIIYHRGQQGPATYTGISGYIVQPTTRVIRRRTVGLGI